MLEKSPAVSNFVFLNCICSPTLRRMPRQIRVRQIVIVNPALLYLVRSSRVKAKHLEALTLDFNR